MEDSVFQVWLLGNNHVWVIIKGQSLKQWCYNGLCRSWWYRRSQAWTLAPCLFGNKGLTEESSALRVRAYKNRCRRMFLQAQKRHFLTPMSYTMVCCCPACVRGQTEFDLSELSRQRDPCSCTFLPVDTVNTMMNRFHLMRGRTSSKSTRSCLKALGSKVWCTSHMPGGLTRIWLYALWSREPYTPN